MLTAIKGIYDNGQLHLEEAIPNKRAKVIVTFLEDIELPTKSRKSGSMKGKIKISDDFNEPLDDLKKYM